MKARFFTLLFTCLLLLRPALAQSPAPDLSWPAFFNQGTVLTVRLDMSPVDWDTIRRDTTNTLKVRASMTIDGVGPISVDVRRKSSRALPSEADPVKVGLKVDILSSPVPIGVKKLSLENGGDSGPVKEGVAWGLHQMAAPAGQTPALAAWVNVHVNDRYLGVYVNNEQRDKQFLRNRNLYTEASTWMYKQDDIGLMEREVAPTEDASLAAFNSDAFKTLCFPPFQPASTGTRIKGDKSAGSCPTPADGTLGTMLNLWIDMAGMLRQGAVDALIDNGDGLFSNGKNFFVVDLAGQKRQYFPWDLDGVFRSTSAGIYGVVGKAGRVSQSPYQQIILNHPEMRARYNAVLTDLISGPLSSANVRSYLQDAAQAVTPHLQNDPYHSSAIADFQTLQSWLSARYTSVLRQAASNGPPNPR